MKFSKRSYLAIFSTFALSMASFYILLTWVVRPESAIGLRGSTAMLITIVLEIFYLLLTDEIFINRSSLEEKQKEAEKEFVLHASTALLIFVMLIYLGVNIVLLDLWNLLVRLEQMPIPSPLKVLVILLMVVAVFFLHKACGKFQEKAKKVFADKFGIK